VNEIQFNNIEIIVVEGCKGIEVKFFMKINLNLPMIISKKSINIAVLLLLSILGSQTCIISELYLPIHLQNLYDGSKSLHIPPVTDLKYIDSYALQLIKSINKKVSNI
jgi:hypothetical protein